MPFAPEKSYFILSRMAGGRFHGNDDFAQLIMAISGLKEALINLTSICFLVLITALVIYSEEYM